MNQRMFLKNSFDKAIECARLIGAVETLKAHGTFTQRDAAFIDCMYQSIAEYRTTVANMVPDAEPFDWVESATTSSTP